MSRGLKNWREGVRRIRDKVIKKASIQLNNQPQQSEIDKTWLDLQYHDAERTRIKRPHELQSDMKEPPVKINENLLEKIKGSIIGMAIGDALGAHVEFRPHSYLVQNPVTDLQEGGTWGLDKGQFTDDTSMALCLANSLVTQKTFSLYDQLVRYKWWYREGYMSSTGQCFDIGMATSESLKTFERRQNAFVKKHNIPKEHMDYLSKRELIKKFDVYCSYNEVAGNGALMRLAPVPLFFHRHPCDAVKYSGHSGQITHGDKKAYDACRYYGALIVAALNGYTKEQILDKEFYSKQQKWFGEEPLCSEIQRIAEGSYQKPRGYDDGIRGKGYIVDALEAALWAFWSDQDSFENGALAAVNLGDDTDTTAAIYGQLAGAYYGYRALPSRWRKYVYAKKFMINLSKWIAYEGDLWQPTTSLSDDILTSESPSDVNDFEKNPTVDTNENGDSDSSSSGAVAGSKVSKSNKIDLQNSLSLRHHKHENPESDTLQLDSSSVPTKNDEEFQHIEKDSHSTLECAPGQDRNPLPTDKPELSMHSLSPEEHTNMPDSTGNTVKIVSKTKRSTSKRQKIQFISSTNAQADDNNTNSNQRIYQQDDKKLTVIGESCSSEKLVGLTKTSSFSGSSSKTNPASENSLATNEENSIAEEKRDSLLPDDSVRGVQLHTKHSNTAPSMSVHSRKHSREAATNMQNFNSTNVDNIDSQISTNSYANDKQSDETVTFDIESTPETSSKPRKREKKPKTTSTTGLAKSPSTDDRNTDKIPS